MKTNVDKISQNHAEGNKRKARFIQNDITKRRLDTSVCLDSIDHKERNITKPDITRKISTPVENSK